MPPAAISKHRVSDHAALLKRRIPPPPLSVGSRILGVLQTVAVGLGAVGATCGLAMGVALASGQYDAVLTLFNNPVAPVSFAATPTNTTALLESLYASVNLTLLRGRDGDPGEVILFNGTVVHGIDGKDCVLPVLFNGTDGRDGDNCTVTPALLALNATSALHTQQIAELYASDASHDAFLLGLTTLVLETNASLVRAQDTQFLLLHDEVDVLHARVDAVNATLQLNALVGTDASHDASILALQGTDTALGERMQLLNETIRSWQGQTNLALLTLSDRVTAETDRVSILNASRLAWESQTQGTLDVLVSADLSHTVSLDALSARVTTVNDTLDASVLALTDATQAIGDAVGARITVVNETLRALQATMWVAPALTGGGSWTGGPVIDALTVAGTLTAPVATLATVDVTGYLRATHIHSLAGTLNIGDSDNTTVLNLATGPRMSVVNYATDVGATVHNFGGPDDTIYITGNLVVVTATYLTESNLAVTDKRVYVNLGGLAGSSGQAGLYVVDGAFNNTVYARQVLGLNAWEFKSRDGPLIVLDQNLQTTADVVFHGLTLTLTLGVGGAATLSSTLNVAALSTLASLLVSGTTTLSGTLGVTGLSTLGSVSVPGAATFSSTVGVSGLLSGAAATFTTLGASGAVSLSSTIGVTGAATFGSTVSVTGLVSGTSATFSTTLGVTGAVTFGSTVGITGLLSGASASLGGSLGVGTTLSVTGGATFLSTVSIAALLSGAAATFTTLGASGAVTLSTTLGVTGACTFGSTVTVTGLWSGTSATLSTTLGVTGAATFGSTVGVTGILSGTSATLSTTLGVTGAATFSSTVGITGLLSGTTASFSNTAATAVQTQGGLKFTGAAATGVQFQNGGGSVLSYYEELSPDFSSTFSGALSAISASISFKITRIGRVVHMAMVSGFTGTCNTAASINSGGGTGLPARFIPSVQVSVGCAVLNAGVETVGLCEVNSAGFIYIFNGGSQKSFSNTGSCGLKQLTISWPV